MKDVSRIQPVHRCLSASACCLLQRGGCFKPVPSPAALKLFSGCLCHDNLDSSTQSFSSAVWGCVNGLRFSSPSATGALVQRLPAQAVELGTGGTLSCLPSSVAPHYPPPLPLPICCLYW